MFVAEQSSCGDGDDQMWGRLEENEKLWRWHVAGAEPPAQELSDKLFRIASHLFSDN